MKRFKQNEKYFVDITVISDLLFKTKINLLIGLFIEIIAKVQEQSNESVAVRCENELKCMKSNLAEVMHNMEEIKRKIELIQQKN